jgi:predicted transcriptional regulator
MRKIQDTNISFRATDELKRRLTQFCEQNDLHNSFVIRQALAAYLQRGTVPEVPPIEVAPSALSRS